jgi:hypothetical protein
MDMKHVKRLQLVYVINYMCMITSNAEVHCLPLCKSGLMYRKQERIKLKSCAVLLHTVVFKKSVANRIT